MVPIIIWFFSRQTRRKWATLGLRSTSYSATTFEITCTGKGAKGGWACGCGAKDDGCMKKRKKKKTKKTKKKKKYTRIPRVHHAAKYENGEGGLSRYLLRLKGTESRGGRRVVSCGVVVVVVVVVVVAGYYSLSVVGGGRRPCSCFSEHASGTPRELGGGGGGEA